MNKFLTHLLILLLPCCLSNAYAKTYSVENNNIVNLRTLINASAPGDTIALAAGKWYIAETLKLDKSIHLKGSGIEKTILINSSVSGAPMIQYNASKNLKYSFKLSDMTLQGKGV
ncbi:MAG: hypothetical protein R3240_02190, partial [Gammaproteobacteria bacterium]|nr:hypothetical protein [Gammaproteobacteria bacterium]